MENMEWVIRIIILIELIAGAGILLYGIDVMKDALEKVTENRMEKTLVAFTKNPFLGIIAGAVVTTVNQKSTSTSMMAVGFASAGVLTLTQAAGVIMGANIGTTVTAQILAFNLEPFAAVLVGFGALSHRFFNNKKYKEFSLVVLGFGLMFVGMFFLKAALSPFSEFALVQRHAINFDGSNIIAYIIAMIIGAILTGMINSSSVITGVMIAMALQGMLAFELAMPLILGVNVGKCFPTLKSSIGSVRTARRAAAIHLIFNLVGVLIFSIFFRNLLGVVVDFLAPGDIARQIAWAHTLFNLVNTIILFPFIKYIVLLTDKIIGEKGEEEIQSVMNLDKRMLETPSLAIAQTYHELTGMTRATMVNFDLSFSAFLDKDDKKIKNVFIEEEIINKMQKEAELYLVKLSQKNISKSQHERVNILMEMVVDIERTGDLSSAIAELTVHRKENGIVLSETAKKELMELHDKVYESYENTIVAMKTSDIEIAKKVIESTKDVINIEDYLRQRHVERLNKGECAPGAGIVFIDLISNMVQIMDHVSNLCEFIVEYKRI